MSGSVITPAGWPRRCRVCGCTARAGCPEGCWWAAPGLCSSCARALKKAGAFRKVSVGRRTGIMHTTAGRLGSHTLCGRVWWAANDHGAGYCRTCQHELGRLVGLLEGKWKRQS